MIRYAVTIISLILIVACGKKGSSNAETKLRDLNNQYDSALLKNDLDALNKLYAEDFVYTNPEGKVLNKSEQIANIKASEVRLEQGLSTNVKVKIYGNTAVMTGNFIAKGNYRGNPVSINERYTVTWIKTDTSWQMVAEQANVVR
jgi:ketosteroid isomerase-like protein